MTEPRDPEIERIVQLLQPLPQVRPLAMAGLLVAVAAERERVRERVSPVSTSGMRRWMVSGVATLLAAGLVGVLLLRSNSPMARSSDAPRDGAATIPEARLAVRGAEPDVAGATQEVELVLRAPTASRVQVAGDFNGWNQHAASMRRDSASGLWSTRLTLRPGRHVYAFVVDDSVWMPDPRAPAARDADFGRPGSVLLVGRP